MNNDYYIDVVTKNILTMLSEHISDAISDQVINIMRTAMTQVDTKIGIISDSINRDMSNSIQDKLSSLKEHLQEIDTLRSEQDNMKQTLTTMAKQLDSFAQYVKDGLSYLTGKLRNSIDNLESRMLQSEDKAISEMAGSLGVISETMADIKGALGGISETMSDIKGSLGESNKAQLDALSSLIRDVGSKITFIDVKIENSLGAMQKKIAEIKETEQSLTTANAQQIELIRMVLEGELRNADMLAQRLESSKREISDGLMRLKAMADTDNSAQ
ncbi:MAG: hypothetical protein SFH39_17960 [Candidatus Magnetobacterium sp. LHC-1]|uniref:Uncharacterized protein n=1 Tax=Candidatus Magnetobacterium casense TaxID=1455061 RepID=A0ABS6RW26_9BACT|nr:hypothetical protein [Candidatus Magnetobacterium casensis]MBF0608694.1 hypothetical protein [Nitrospirota bacterium]MBV6340832.1 hypothetical protein [Candidatus Magnetobacterium casensis]